MRALIIDERVRAYVQKVVIPYAKAHRFVLADIMHLMAHPEEAPGNTPEFVAKIPMGYRAVYTEEQQPFGWCRHISVSVMAKGRLPNEHAVLAIMQLFQFRGGLKDCHVNVMEEQVDSVNVIEPFNAEELAERGLSNEPSGTPA